MRDERDARRNQLGTRRLDLDVGGACPERSRGVGLRESDPVVGAWLLAILELGLRDGRSEIDVPQRRRFELIGSALLQQPQERRLRDLLRARVDGGVGARPFHRQTEVSPEMLERLLVFGGQPPTELDEVRTRDGDCLLTRLVRRRRTPGSVRQRRIAANTVVVLHPALGRQSVVVPAHRIEDGLAPHALESRDDVGVGVREHVTDVERPADGRRRRIDRIDPIPPAIAGVEAVGAVRFPRRGPFRLEAFECWLLW